MVVQVTLSEFKMSRHLRDGSLCFNKIYKGGQSLG